jgi:hypothetical protein
VSSSLAPMRIIVSGEHISRDEDLRPAGWILVEFVGLTFVCDTSTSETVQRCHLGLSVSAFNLLSTREEGDARSPMPKQKNQVNPYLYACWWCYLDVCKSVLHSSVLQ